MKFQKKISIVVLFLYFLFVLTILIYEWNTYCYNQNLEKNFIPNQKVPKYSWIYKEFGDVVPIPTWYMDKKQITLKEMAFYYLALQMEPDWYYPPTFNTFVLEQDLHYYSEPNTHSEAKIIKKGTTVYVSAYEILRTYFSEKDQWKVLMLDLISGSHTFPSYDKNWRLAIPYFTVEELKQEEIPEIKAYYFTTQELQSSIHAYQKQSEEFYDKKPPGSFSNYFYIDWELYTHGYYISPNLYKTYHINLIGLGICLSGIVLFIILSLLKRKSISTSTIL